MSYYTTFKTYGELMEYLQNKDYPQCFMMNYLPNTNEFALWIGSQPYYVCEEWIKELEDKVRGLMKENKQLKEKYNDLKERVEVIQDIIGFKL